MADKPEKFPDWALEDEVDEVSGQLNVVEPPAQRFDSGWTRREIPPRQWMNWLLRKTALWFRWLEDKVEGLQYATEAEAQDGTNPGKVISPLTLRQALNADNAPPVFGVRAWANFKGTDPLVINGLGNIDSIVRTAEGQYQVTFSVSMPDANYCVSPGGSQFVDGAGSFADAIHPYDLESTGFKIETFGADESVADLNLITFSVVR